MHVYTKEAEVVRILEELLRVSFGLVWKGTVLKTGLWNLNLTKDQTPRMQSLVLPHMSEETRHKVGAGEKPKKGS